MSSKYDKSIQISREEEGSYHRREVESSPGRPPKSYTTESYEVLPVKSSGGGGGRQVSSHYKDYTSDEDNYDEWTTSKRKVNHKTRQVETRVSRQLLVEDGKVIADSGPQVTTRIKEDNKVEECEKEKAPKNRGRFEALEGAPEGESSGRVLGEKKEIQRVTREVREENMQYHDERFKELTGPEVHRSATRAPHELITISDHKSGSAPRGKMVHYSQKGKKTRDTDEILEVAKLAIDGSITKEVKRTKHHEESSEDEKPDEAGEAEALRREPVALRSSRRGADYVNDFDDTSSCPSEDEQRPRRAGKTSGARQHSASGGRHSHQHQGQDEAFPRYQLDPLLNSLKDDDFVVRHEPNAQRHRLERKQRMDSSDDDRDDDHDRHRHQRQHHSRQAAEPARPVEIPEEYRVHRQQHRDPTRVQHEPVERSLSPAHHAARSQPKSHHRQHHGHREDASVQAHLSDEEEQHERQARQLQRQSTGGSRRNYYYGDQRRPKSPAAASSASSSDLSDPKEQMRGGKSHQATSGRDSGFKSPHSHRQATPISKGDADDEHQIYSVSSKAARRDRVGATSPTPSAGQRSVKTSVTTVAAGMDESRAPRRPTRAGGKRESNSKQEKAFYLTQSHFNSTPPRTGAGEQRTRRSINTSNHYQYDYDPARASASTISGARDGGRRERRPSASSLASCTTIKVPYCGQAEEPHLEGSVRPVKEMADSEMSFEEDIRHLRRRLADIENGQQHQNYNYRTVVSQVQPAPQLVGAYNVRIIEQQNPFEVAKDESIARLEDLSNELSSSLQLTNGTLNTNMDNNNEPNFNLNDYTKHKAVPARVDSTGDSLVAADDLDGLSLVSSTCSLRSSRTYHIRSDELQSAKAPVGCKTRPEDEDLDDERDFPVVSNQPDRKQLDLEELEKDKSKPAAWIFDPHDGSSTAIVAPPKPERPTPAQVDSKELAESRGGQSYYLEVHDSAAPTAKPSLGAQVARRPPRPASIDSLYSRWNSQGTLVARKDERKQQRQVLPAASVGSRSVSVSRPNLSSSGQQLEKDNGSNPLSAQRRQLPFMGSQLSNRSKSSSCLASSTRPSKYSIYGGLKGDNKKPVPRLSYSRAIGPKSQRPPGDSKQQQQQPRTKTPSRYLKMK